MPARILTSFRGELLFPSHPQFPSVLPFCTTPESQSPRPHSWAEQRPNPQSLGQKKPLWCSLRDSDMDARCISSLAAQPPECPKESPRGASCLSTTVCPPGDGDGVCLSLRSASAFLARTAYSPLVPLNTSLSTANAFWTRSGVSSSPPFRCLPSRAFLALMQ